MIKQDNRNISKQELPYRNRDMKWILQNENKKLKNPIDRIRLYLLLYLIQEEIQKYLDCRKGELMGKTSQMFLSVSEVQGLLGMSKSYCYELVAKLNDELEKMDKIVIPGKVPTQFFLEKFYGMEITDEMLEAVHSSSSNRQVD